jgi:hypothetical protein
MRTLKPGKYQHYKGNYYRVIGVGKHSETSEEFVVYESLYDHPQSHIWIRPKEMFLEDVLIEGKSIPRFRYIDEAI